MIEPIGMKLTVELDITEYKAALAKSYNVEPDQIEVIIVGGEMGPIPERKTPTFGDIVGDLSKPKQEDPFLWKFLQAKGLNSEEAAKLCDVSAGTICRARYGYRLRKGSFERIAKGLGMTLEETKEFRKSLRLKQRNYHQKERRGL